MNNYNKIKQVAAVLLMCLFPAALSAQLNIDRLLTVGKNALYFEDYLLSIQYFNQVINAKPYLAEPYFFRGLAKFYLEDYKGAETDCTSAIERNPFIVDAYEVRGLSRLSSGEYEGAVTDYEKGLEYRPENKIFMLNKAIAQQNLKRFDDAEKTYDGLLTAYPKYDKGYLGRAHLHLLEGDTVAAMSDLDKEIELNGNEVTAYLARAELNYNKFGEKEKALADMDKAIKLEPKLSDLFVNRAYMKYNMDDYFGAMADFDYAIGLEPTNTTARFNRGLLKMEVRDNKGAVEDFSYIIEKEPENYKALYNRAVVYQQMRNYKSAIKDFDKLIKQYPHFPSLYFMRSECKRLSGDMRGGERDYNKSREMQKRHEERLHIVKEKSSVEEDVEETTEDVINKFTSLMAVENDNSVKPEYDNKYRGHIQNYNTPIDVAGIYALTYYDNTTDLRANGYYQRELDELNSSLFLRERLYMTNSPRQMTEVEINKQFELIQYYSKLLNTDNKRAVDYFGRALSYLLLKNYDSAIEDFTKAIEQSPHFTLAYYERSVAEYLKYKETHSSSVVTGNDRDRTFAVAQAEMKQIVDDLDKTLELSPGNIYVYYNKGNIYYESEKYTAAISCYTQAIDAKKDFGEAYYNRGIAYFRLGNMEKGMADLSRAGELGMVSSYNLLKRMRQNKK